MATLDHGALGRDKTRRGRGLHPGGPGTLGDPRRRILGAAARLFREKGYSGTTLREIARAAAIKAGSLYYYFPSKEAILNEVLDQGIGALMANLRQAIAQVPAGGLVRPRIEAAIRAHLQALLDRGDESTAYVRMYAHLPNAIKQRKHPIRQEYLGIWKDLLADAQRLGEIRPEIDIEFLYLFVVGALTRAVEWYDPRWGSIDALSRAAIDTLFSGLAPRALPGAIGAGAGPLRQPHDETSEDPCQRV